MADDRSIQDRITGFWSTVASGYEAHSGNVPAEDSEEYQAWVRLFAKLLPPAPASVLDVATGTGFVAKIAATLGHRVTAIDLSPEMLAEAGASAAKRNLAIDFRKDDAVAPGLAGATFDALTNRHFLWTLRDPDTALANWRRLLKPGGRLIAIDGFFFKPEPDDATGPEDGLFETFYTRETRRALPGWRYFSVEPLIAIWQRAGFRDVKATSLEEIHRLAKDPPGPEPAYVLTGTAP